MKRFKLTEEHIKLSKRLIVSLDETNPFFPTIYVGSKRPYGNSDIEGDIAEILGISDNRRHKDDEPYYYPEDIERMKNLHKEMCDAVQIILVTGKAEVGTYCKSAYGTDWHKITLKK